MFGMLMHYEKTTASTAMMINVLANENCSFMPASYHQRKEKARRACAEGCPGQSLKHDGLDDASFKVDAFWLLPTRLPDV
jgi:hypothetical protein